MSGFIKKCGVFGVILALTLITPIAVINNTINTGRHFVLPPTTTTLILGSSTAAMSMDDTLIDGSVNMALDGVSYYYKFYQLRKLLDDNPHLERLVLDVPSYVLTKDPDQWIYAPELLLREVPKISCMMTPLEQLGLCVESPETFLLSQKNVLMNNVNFLKMVRRDGEGSFIHYADWGRYIASDKSHVLKVKEGASPSVLSSKAQISSEEVKWLKKCVEVAQAKAVEVVLIHSPRHALTEATNPNMLSTTKYHDLMSKEFPGIHFHDYSGFPLTDADFTDYIHLNKHGAAKFSAFLNTQLQDLSKAPAHLLH